MSDDLLSLLSRLRAGFHPGPTELARAALIEDWQIVPTIGPFALAGCVGGEGVFAVLLALDAEAGWALVSDRWFRLGRGSGSLAHSDEIMRRAALWLAEGGPPLSFETRPSDAPQDEGGSCAGGWDEARRIATEAALLAQRAERAGLAMAAYLLDMAAMEAGAQR